jgi:hypothetical protein
MKCYLILFVLILLICTSGSLAYNSKKLFSFRISDTNLLHASSISCVGNSACITETVESENLARYVAKMNVLKRPLAVMTGTLSAWLLQSYLKLDSPLVAAVAVGLTSIPLSPRVKYQAPLYCGAFAGTTSVGIVNRPSNILALALIAASLFELFERKELFPGKGGRLGMCATISSTILAFSCSQTKVRRELFDLLRSITNWTSIIAIDSTRVYDSIRELLSILGPAIISASGGSVACTALRRRGWSPVAASAIVGSLGTLGLARFVGNGLGGLFYMGSFIGMSANANDKIKAPYTVQIFAASLAVIFFQGFGQFVLAGVGGKLGAAALCGVLATGAIQVAMEQQQKFATTIRRYRYVPNM